MFIVHSKRDAKFVGMKGRLVSEYPDAWQCKTLSEAKKLAKEARDRGANGVLDIWEYYGLENEYIRETV